MTGDLEARLESLGPRVFSPQAPDVTSTLAARLPSRSAGARRGGWATVARPPRTLGRALAAIVLAGVAVVVPASRHAILRGLGLRGVSVERGPALPASRRPARGSGSPLGLGRPIPLAEVRHAVSFTPALPRDGPRHVYLAGDVPGGRISLLLPGGVLVTEFRGTSIPTVFKVIGPHTRVRRLRLAGHTALYLTGALHEVLFELRGGTVRTDRVRLAGNVLLWQDGPVTVRIEGTRSLAAALAVAGSLSARSADARASGGASASACPVTRASGPRPPLAALLNFGSPVGRPSDPGWYGNGVLWTRVPWAWPRQQGTWMATKVGWFRATPGNVRLDARLTGSPRAGFSSDVGTVAEYGPSGFTASGLSFSRPGCWVVRARLAGTVLRVVVRVPATPVAGSGRGHQPLPHRGIGP